MLHLEGAHYSRDVARGWAGVNNCIFVGVAFTILKHFLVVVFLLKICYFFFVYYYIGTTFC